MKFLAIVASNEVRVKEIVIINNYSMFFDQKKVVQQA
jgi:hypothetical protein